LERNKHRIKKNGQREYFAQVPPGEIGEPVKEETQEEMWMEFFEDVSKASYSVEQSHKILSKKWNLTRK
jgi:hypothetical protein